MLAFLIKALRRRAEEVPEFNASLDGDNLVYKQYYNIGFAADTPNGLVVPVIKNADQKGVLAIAKEMGELRPRRAKASSARRHAGRLLLDQLEPGRHRRHRTSRRSSTRPEVAILGVSAGRARSPVVGRQAVRAAADPAAVAVLRPPRDRWCQQRRDSTLSVGAARRHEAECCLTPIPLALLRVRRRRRSAAAAQELVTIPTRSRRH